MGEHTMNIVISAENFDKFMDWMNSFEYDNSNDTNIPTSDSNIPKDKINKKKIDEKDKRIFEEKFEKYEEMRDSFENVCASIRSIATVTNIPLDVVAELFTDKIKEAVNGAECQEMVEVLRDLFY